MNLQRTGLLIALCLTALTACDGRQPAKGMHTAAPPTSAVPASSPASSPERFVVGTLGGMKVRIPWHFVNLMEFSGESTDWKRGPRSPASRPAGVTRDIASFGFEVRYPDMAGLSTPALRREHHQRPFKVNRWLDVSITSGDIYPPRAVEMMVARIRPVGTTIYDPEPSDVAGLTKYVAQGTDQRTGEPLRYQLSNPDVYIPNKGSGREPTVIHCTNTETGRQACKLYFTLEPDSQTLMKVRFGRDMLAQWEDIQQRTRALMLSFRID